MTAIFPCAPRPHTVVSSRHGVRSWGSGKGKHMDMSAYLPLIVQALGGLAASNIAGALTRGGGGVLGRSIIGIIGGLAAGQGLPQVAQADGALDAVYGLAQGDVGQHLGNLIVGASGGGVLGLIAGLVLRPRR